MGVNGVSTVNTNTYSSAATAAANTTEQEKTTAQAASETPAATYEKSNEETKKTTAKPDLNMVEQMKADAEARHSQLRSLVEKMMLKQSDTAIKSGSIYDLLRTGQLNVDDNTRLQAQKDIADDGYWGVEQTSDRLVSFAKALSGGDVTKADKLIESIKKGFGEAEKSWGGKLPDISQKTLDATLKKMDDWKKELSE